MGYHRAGFEVTGVDNNPMPRYPFSFIQDDALTYLEKHGHEYDAIHASPPCQAYSRMHYITGKEYPELIPPTRELLKISAKPYVIENVVGAPLIMPIRLCGLNFGLRVYRHRLFECSFFVMAPRHPAHRRWLGETKAKMGDMPLPGQYMTVAGHYGGKVQAEEAMGIDWMSREELSQAIPPSYTEFIGRQWMEHFR